eukprot:TRINITY_DN2231_c0_g1_i2.p1 TRINITY_DN2231_c0_g1~~TRINITY_DN2231_c0_g1_i2.p1  ORF type:complete len:126 (+),score=12.69 TRINITY_DN2231_c0_g1_i2:126-503(+)
MRCGWAVVLLAVACCAVGTSKIVITEKDHDAKLSVAPKQPVEIHLPSNPSTGYDWYAHELPEGLIITEAYRVSVQNPPGASGTRIITVTAADGVVGEHLVELHYKRVWEKSTPPSKVFRVRLVVL